MGDYKPKHEIFDKEKFANERAFLGGLAQVGMNTTGGTDIDWVIEHRGGFVVNEFKTFKKDWKETWSRIKSKRGTRSIYLSRLWSKKHKE